MKLEKDQEVWIRVKVKDSVHHKEGVWGVVLKDHLSPSPQEHNMFIHEDDIVTGLIYKDYCDGEEPIPAWGEGLLEMIANHADGHDETNDKLEERVAALEEHIVEIDEFIAPEPESFDVESWLKEQIQLQMERDRQVCRQLLEMNLRIVRDWANPLIEEWDNPYDDWWDHAGNPLEWDGYIYDPDEGWVQHEEPTECECSPECMYRDYWPYCWTGCPRFPSKVTTSGSVTYKPPEIHNVCRVCDKPIGRGKPYCNLCQPTRTGAEVISSMKDK